ncbi:MAG: fumarylacetoacetate hydrolase family protein, partial [Rhizobiales bacterium]|nr:fumarylacetoacetate hydrolase family protein [Hyphomicrobiales bacterium]
MKLASLKNNSRDGTLYVVSKDLKTCISATNICATMQNAMDDWANIKPKLEIIYDDLNAGKLDSVIFDQSATESPLPRAYQWADGSAYVNHVVLVRRARGAEVPDSFWHDPLMYQGGSDKFIGSHDDIEVADEAFGIDFEAEIAVITGDVPMAATPDEAAKEIRLFMLVNDVSLRGLIPAELAKGFGFFQSKPSSAFSPVAVTPDELEEVYKDGRVKLPLLSTLNGTLFGKPNAGVDM